MTDRPFRVYEDNTVQHQLYSDMHENQSYNFALVKQLEYSHFGTRCEMTMKDALSMMDRFVDPSDPDLPDVAILYTHTRLQREFEKNTRLIASCNCADSSMT